MYYELYIDSLFLINFVMNLYLLELVNRTLSCSVTRRRVIGGAVVGAALYLAPFFLPGPAWLKLFAGLAASAAGMIGVTFRVKSVKAFFRVMEKLVLYSFLLGGSLLFVIRCFPGIRGILTSVFGLLGLGALVFLEVSHLLNRKKSGGDICRVVLTGRGARITVSALVDTGNCLWEPISGKPVSVLEKSVFDGLWREGEPGGYRAVPYHSVGRRNGILQGYVIPEIQVEVDGVMKICRDVYVGVSEEKLSGGDHYKMILNPRLLET